MTDQKPIEPLDLGTQTGATQFATLTRIEGFAAALSLAWLLFTVVFFGFLQDDAAGNGIDSVRFVMVLLAIFLPVALIWVAAAAVRSARVVREESARLHAAISALRHAYLTHQPGGARDTAKSVEKKLEEIVAAQRKTDATIATFVSIRPAPSPADKPAIAVTPKPEEQGLLALGTPAEALDMPLNVSDFIRALNFPESADDKEGFRALRRALQDRKVSQLVQAAQDMLTLLSQDGIYMDDLRPDRARPEIWRQFANGERGRAVAALGGVRDRSSLALTTGRMRQDAIFRDAAHHFLRKFDHTFAEFAKTASDQDISDLADTRTARAFMLMGRVTGTFD